MLVPGTSRPVTTIAEVVRQRWRRACGMRAGAIGLVARRHRVPELVFAPDSHPEHAHALLEDRRVPGRNPQSVLQCLCHEHTVERITMLPL
jgi:hypothetical protein